MPCGSVEPEPFIEGLEDLRKNLRTVYHRVTDPIDSDVDITTYSFSVVRRGLAASNNLTADRPAACWASSAIRGRRLTPSTPTLNLLGMTKITAQNTLDLWRDDQRLKISTIVGEERRARFLTFPISAGGFCDEGALCIADASTKCLRPVLFASFCQIVTVVSC